MLRAIFMFFVLRAINGSVGAPLKIYNVEFQLEADGLPGSPDPICKVRLQQTGQGGFNSWKETEQLSSTNNPKWSKLFEIAWATDGVNKELKFEIWDKNTKLIAQYIVDVKELVRINNFDESSFTTDTPYDIKDASGNKVGTFLIKHRIASTQSNQPRCNEGNEFGSLRNFGPENNRIIEVGSNEASHTAHNPDALAPEGVFTPSIETMASHYLENDPYLADSDTAAIAAKHSPFFAKFPHKRTVLALNERRKDNGLEPNLLRSIRPFLPFFGINK